MLACGKRVGDCMQFGSGDFMVRLSSRCGYIPIYLNAALSPSGDAASILLTWSGHLRGDPEVCSFLLGHCWFTWTEPTMRPCSCLSALQALRKTLLHWIVEVIHQSNVWYRALPWITCYPGNTNNVCISLSRILFGIIICYLFWSHYPCFSSILLLTHL